MSSKPSHFELSIRQAVVVVYLYFFLNHPKPSLDVRYSIRSAIQFFFFTATKQTNLEILRIIY